MCTTYKAFSPTDSIKAGRKNVRIKLGGLTWDPLRQSQYTGDVKLTIDQVVEITVEWLQLDMNKNKAEVILRSLWLYPWLYS